jgi:hypothetical protein
MARVQKIRAASGCQSSPVPPADHTCYGADGIDFYGWDSPSETWHGPNELGSCSLPDRRLLVALRAAPAKSWFGPVSCNIPGESATRFFALVHDLSDCAIASIYCDESKAGPAAILAVIPPGGRSRLRDEFAFEFLSFARFLGAVSPGAALLVHDAITSAVAGLSDSKALVLSISSGLWPSDFEHVLSRCIEKVAVTLCQWLDDPYAPARHSRPGSTTAA